jgi:hypothetical protein
MEIWPFIRVATLGKLEAENKTIRQEQPLFIETLNPPLVNDVSTGRRRKTALPKGSDIYSLSRIRPSVIAFVIGFV